MIIIDLWKTSEFPSVPILITNFLYFNSSDNAHPKFRELGVENQDLWSRIIDPRGQPLIERIKNSHKMTVISWQQNKVTRAWLENFQVLHERALSKNRRKLSNSWELVIWMRQMVELDCFRWDRVEWDKALDTPYHSYYSFAKGPYIIFVYIIWEVYMRESEKILRLCQESPHFTYF